MPVVTDVTAEVEAATVLQRNERRFRALIEHSQDVVSLSDADGTILYISPAVERITGDPPAEFVGKRTFLRIHADDLELVTRAFVEIRRAPGATATVQFRALHRDGSYRWVECAGTNFLTDPDVGAIVGNSRDITAKKELEEELRQSQKMEAIGRLAGGVAHDFNNELSVILSYGYLIGEQLDAMDPMREDVAEICKAGDRAAQLTRQLLLFSRRQPLELRVFDLSNVLTHMDKMLRRLVGEDVAMDTAYAPDLWRIEADPGSIEQIVMNLVVNARDAMPSGGTLTLATANVVLGEAEVRRHPGMTPGRHVVLRVSDTGVGMDAATRAHIFEPFFTTKEPGKGTGLGLSTVFGIVQQSRGSVTVESAPGKGTAFEIHLPSVDAAADPARPSEAPSTLRGSETILLVEDEDPVRAVARGILQRQGYRVLEARNAGEALLHCEQHGGDIHLLLSDVVMPQMSGPDLAQRLLRERPSMRVLCMSGYADERITSRGVVDSGFAYLSKPLTPRSLVSKVREVLDAPQRISDRGGR